RRTSGKSSLSAASLRYLRYLLLKKSSVKKPSVLPPRRRAHRECLSGICPARVINARLQILQRIARPIMSPGEKNGDDDRNARDHCQPQQSFSPVHFRELEHDKIQRRPLFIRQRWRFAEFFSLA